MWCDLDFADKLKCVVVAIGFFVAVIATIICPFSAVITAGMVGKLWATYFLVQILWAVLDGSMAEFVCIMMSLLRR